MSKAKEPVAETYASVWDAIADTPHEAANLRIRAALIADISRFVQNGGWTQTEAATRCGVTQPRINDLLRGRISRFSIDALVNIAASLGRVARVELEPSRSKQVARKVRAQTLSPSRTSLAKGPKKALGARKGARVARTD